MMILKNKIQRSLRFMRFILRFVTIYIVCCQSYVQASKSPSEPLSKSEQKSELRSQIQSEWERFVKEPHPMGSEAQFTYANHLKTVLKAKGWKVFEQRFSALVPGRTSTSGNLTKQDSKEVLTDGKTALPKRGKVEGNNVVAFMEGTQKCHFVLAGHYDTKYFGRSIFVGANDGGSSTVTLISFAELAKKWRKKLQKSNDSVIWCDWSLVFFDGEEANLEDWYAGSRLYNEPDNLYGSREFGRKLESKKDGSWFPFWSKKSISAAIVVDMVGHKNQKIFMSGESHPAMTKTFLEHKGNLKLEAWEGVVEDDHKVFVNLKIPVVHMIDWTNLKEWHTPLDNLESVSADSIETLLAFFERIAALPLKEFPFIKNSGAKE